MCFFCSSGLGLSPDAYTSHVTSAPVGGINHASGPGKTELIAQTFDATDNRYEFTGDQDVDAVLIGSRWTLPALTFSFPTSGALYAGSGYAAGTEPDGQVAFNAQQQTAVRYALNLVSSYTNLKFTEIAETATQHANLRLSQTSQTDDVPSALGNFPSSKGRAGDVWFGTDPQPTYTTPAKGNWGQATVMHELGHTLGLKHGHQDYTALDISTAEGGLVDAPAGGGPRFGSAALPSTRDGQDWSLMTYRSDPSAGQGTDPGPFEGEGFNQPQTYMQDDIAALQHLYGANFTTNAGASVYTWSATTGEGFINGVSQGAPTANKILLTVWDGGGVDTYDLSNYSTNLSVNLNPGAFSTFSTGQLVNHQAVSGGDVLSLGNIANAKLYHNDLRSLIENATGGSGNDTFIGNQAANLLKGGEGNDRLEGGLGNDRLYGGGARIGQTGGGPGLVFGSGEITFASNPGNTTLQTAVDISKQFSLDENANIFESTNVPHVTVTGVGGGQGDLYKITITGSLTLLTIDVDMQGLTNTFDSVIGIYDSSGNLQFTNDDNSSPDPGSAPRTRGDGTVDTTDSFAQFVPPNPGVYYIGVFRFEEATGNTVAVANGQHYRFHVSAFREPVAEEIRTGDILDGGAGVDTADYSAAVAGIKVDLGLTTKQTAAGGAQNDLLTSIESIVGSRFADTLTAAAAGSSLFGGLGVDTLTGRGGADVLQGNAGADKMAGGAGNDQYYVDDVGDTVTEAANAGIDTVFSAITYTLGLNVERLTLTGTGAIKGTGNAVANLIIGNAAANTLDGGGGADDLRGGGGNDTYVVDAVNDHVTELANSGIDTVQASVSYTLALNVERLTLTGTGAINGTGNGLANLIIGNGAANIINGLGGADDMRGGMGDDTYIVDIATDKVAEALNAGTDTVQSSVSYTLSANVENLTLTGTAATDATGNNLANVLIGNGAANKLFGLGGSDDMRGGLGNDRYYVTDAGDKVTEAANGGVDIVESTVSHRLALNVENLKLSGAGSISGTGNDGANTIAGNGATNVLNGKLGADTLTGGLGHDSFVFDTALGASNIDRIMDFSVADDTIRIDNAVFLNLATGTLAVNAFAIGTAAADTADRIIYNDATGGLFFDRDGSGTTYAAAQFATVTAHLALTNADFLVI